MTVLASNSKDRGEEINSRDITQENFVDNETLMQIEYLSQGNDRMCSRMALTYFISWYDSEADRETLIYNSYIEYNYCMVTGSCIFCAEL